MSVERAQQSFVVRIWLERGSNGQPVWRGRIRHVQGRREMHFQTVKAMREFLKSVTGVAGPPLDMRAAKRHAPARRDSAVRKKPRH